MKQQSLHLQSLQKHALQVTIAVEAQKYKSQSKQLTAVASAQPENIAQQELQLN